MIKESFKTVTRFVQHPKIRPLKRRYQREYSWFLDWDAPEPIANKNLASARKDCDLTPDATSVEGQKLSSDFKFPTFQADKKYNEEI